MSSRPSLDPQQELQELTEALMGAYEELSLHYAISETLGSSLQMEEVLRETIRLVRQTWPQRGGGLWLLDEDGRLKLAQVFGVSLSEEEVVLVQQAVRQVLDRRRPLIFNDTPQQLGFPQDGIRKLLISPLLNQGEPQGALFILERGDGPDFMAGDQKLLYSLSSHAAAAIRNSRLYAKEQERSRQLAEALSLLQQTYDETLEALSAALDLRDTETEGHSRRVTEYTLQLARSYGVPQEAMVSIERGSILHDIGKIGIPDGILLKPGKLTPEEWDVMRTHPLLGFRILASIDFLRPAIPIVLCHHERFDGKGYPLGLAGETIPLGARLFAVADTLDAMTSDRPYRQALPFEVAAEEIQRNAGKQFDPKVVEAFFRVSREEWLGIRERVNLQFRERRASLDQLANLLLDRHALQELEKFSA